MHTLQTTWSFLNIQLFVYWGFVIARLHNFPYLVNHRYYKVGWPLKMITKMDLLWMFSDMCTRQTTGKAPEMSLFGGRGEGLTKWNFKCFFIPGTICHIRLADQNNRKTHLSMTHLSISQYKHQRPKEIG